MVIAAVDVWILDGNGVLLPGIVVKMLLVIAGAAVDSVLSVFVLIWLSDDADVSIMVVLAVDEVIMVLSAFVLIIMVAT